MILQFNKISSSNYSCNLDLSELYKSKQDLKKFDSKWEEFIASDDTFAYVMQRNKNMITYIHKSWTPIENHNKPSLLILGGNPAPHSVWKDVYYAYEGKGIEHRFWKVLRELGYIDLYGNDEKIKDKFINLNYNSPFRIGMEAMFTFPSTPSKPKWSGVMGLEKLFGKKYLNIIYEIEKIRVHNQINSFLKGNGFILAMQKDAYNAVSKNIYNVKLAIKGELTSEFNGKKVIGTPPTRWLHTKKMKELLLRVRKENS
jgi:hypothetical protein